jgi:hypothetical protein
MSQFTEQQGKIEIGVPSSRNRRERARTQLSLSRYHNCCFGGGNRHIRFADLRVLVAVAKRLSLGSPIHSVPALGNYRLAPRKQRHVRASARRYDGLSSNKGLALCRMDNRVGRTVPGRPSSLMAAGHAFERGSRTRQAFLVYFFVQWPARRSHSCRTGWSRLFMASSAPTSQWPALSNDHSRPRQRARNLLALPWIFMDRAIRAAFDLAALTTSHLQSCPESQPGPSPETASHADAGSSPTPTPAQSRSPRPCRET